jgi:hypothetical protein
MVRASAGGPGLTHHGLLHSPAADLTAAFGALPRPGCTPPTRASCTVIPAEY